LFSKFKEQIDTIFVDVNSASFELEKSANVILSPALYWVRKVSLPVKSVREVKPLLESLFEETLPEGIYSYSVYKQGEEYFIFAYEDKKILDTLHSKGIPSAKINAVYFAQSELMNLDEPKKISEEEIILVQDDIVILLPSQFVQDAQRLDVSDVKVSKNAIHLKQFGHIVNEKSLYTIAAIFLVFIVLVGSEYFITLHKAQKLQTQRERIFSLYDLKSTMFQNKSLLRSYEGEYKTQSKLRESMAKILSLSLKSGDKIKAIEYKNKKLKLQFDGVKSGEEGYITAFMKSKGMKYSAKYKGKEWYVEVQL